MFIPEVSQFIYHDLHNLEPEVSEVLNQLLPKIKHEQDKRSIAELQKSLEYSWCSATNDFYQKYDYTPFLHEFDLNTLMVDIENNWNRGACCMFGQFIEKRYNDWNHYDKFSVEFEAVQSLLDGLTCQKSKLPHGLKKGKISELVSYLEKTISTIKKGQEKLELQKSVTRVN